MLHHPLAGIGIADFDSSSGKRNSFAGFGVFLLKPNEGSKGGVIQNIIVGLECSEMNTEKSGTNFCPSAPAV